MGKGTDVSQRKRRLKTAAEVASTLAKKMVSKVAKAALAKQALVASLSRGLASSLQPPQPELEEDHTQPHDAKVHTAAASSGGDVRTVPGGSAPSGSAPGGSLPVGGLMRVAPPTEAGAAEAGARPLERLSDDVDCADIGDKDGALDGAEHSNSVMKQHARKIIERLRLELSKTGPAVDQWLLRKLRGNGWWLRASCARDVLAGMPASSDPESWPEPFYMRDIYVHLPHVRWGEMPTCPTCLSSSDVRPADFLLDQPTRRFFTGPCVCLRPCPRPQPQPQPHPPAPTHTHPHPPAPTRTRNYTHPTPTPHT